MSKSVTEKQVVVDERLIKPSMVTPTLFVGLGGWGCKIIKQVANQLKSRVDYAERYQKVMRFAGVDTNINDLEKCRNEFDQWFLISDFEKAKYAELSTGKLFLEPDTYFTQWVPEDYRFRVGDTAGAGQIRIESRLGCYYQMKHSTFVDRFRRLIEELRDHDAGHRRIDSGEIRIVICYSVAGGTGSGSHLPMAYMLREQAKLVGKPTVIGVVGLPSIFEDNAGVNKDGIFANGYAALKETEHLMKLGAPESKFYPENGLEFHYDPSDESKRRVYDKPFDFLYVVDKPEKFSVKAVDQAAADGLYLQLFTDIFKAQAGDYDNYTQHQRFLVPHDFEAKDIPGFTSFYGSYGAAVLHVPTADMIDYIARAAALNVLESNWLRDVPGGEEYNSVRTGSYPAYQKVARRDDGAEAEVPVSEFVHQPDEVRRKLQDRLYLKRIRMLARAEREKEKWNGPFLTIWRHGEGYAMVPGSDHSKPDVREAVPGSELADRKNAFTEGRLKYSIAEVVYGQFRRGNASGLLSFVKEQASAKAADGLKGNTGDTAATWVESASRHASLLAEESKRWLGSGRGPGAPGMSLIANPEELFKAADVDVKTQRYVAIRMLDELVAAQRELGGGAKEGAAVAAEPTVTLDDEKKALKVAEDSPGRKEIAKQEVVDELALQIAAVVEFRAVQHMRTTLEQAVEAYRNVVDRFRKLEDSVKKRCEDEHESLKKLLESGSASANRYTLDAEAFQMENGRRLWDFYYEDQIVDGMSAQVSTKAPEIQAFVREAYLRSDRQGDPTEQHNTLLKSVRDYVVGKVREKLEGDPLAKDEELRRGLDIHKALELEVRYRAIYMSNRDQLEAPEGNLVRSLIAQFESQSEAERRKVSASQAPHSDYLRDKIKRIVKEKADYLCVYDESRDAQGGVRPDRVQLCVMTEKMQSLLEKTIRDADDSFKVLTDEWTNPREVVFYKAVLNVPLYVFGRMDRMRDYYYRFRNMAKRSKVLHIDKNWEGDALFDLDPVSAQEKKRAEQLRANIVQYATLRVTGTDNSVHGDEGGEAGRFLFRRDSEWRLLTPVFDSEAPVASTGGDVGLGESISDAVRNLPGVLASNPVRYAPYNQMLAAVQQGLAPTVVQAICRFPRKWRTSRDDLQGQWGPNPTVEQRQRLKDLGEACSGLADALISLLTRLREQQGEAAVLGGDDYSALDIGRDAARQNIEASIQLLQRFSDDWKALENPTARGFAKWLFEPVDPRTLQVAAGRSKSTSKT